MQREAKQQEAAMTRDAETNGLYERMTQARLEWENAAEGFRRAVELFHDVEPNPDGRESLKRAAASEAEALKKYRLAVEAYAKSVGSGRTP